MRPMELPPLPQLPDELDVEEDDIIPDTPPPIYQHSLFSAQHGQSQSGRKVFVEGNKLHQASERSDLRNTSVQMDDITDFQHNQPNRDFSRVLKVFRRFGLYCHGFLAGFALCNVVVVYMLAGPHLTALSNLLEQYHSMVYPCQCLFYVLLAINTVAAMERVESAPDPITQKELLDANTLASALDLSAFVMCIAQYIASGPISQYQSFNRTSWTPGHEHSVLQPWVIVNVVVALFANLAWILIASQLE